MSPVPPAVAAPEVHVSLSGLPPFFGENVTFIANLLGLFFGNEEETQMLADEVGEVDSYGGRLLPILDLIYSGPKRNLLVLEREPDEALKNFFGNDAGLSLPEIAVLPHEDYKALGKEAGTEGFGGMPMADRLLGHAASRIDGYVTDDTLARIGEAIGKKTISTVVGSRRGNNKWLLFEHIANAGLPFPQTEVAQGVDDLEKCVGRLRRGGFQSGVIKAPIGASGIGLVKIPDLADCEEEIASVPEHFFTDGPCLIQGWLAVGEFGIRDICSPSVQLFLDDASVWMYDITEQILSHDSVHEGNESPPPYFAERPGWKEELLRQARVAGTWLHEQGYRGTASVDFLVTEEAGGAFTVYVCEVNARVTGATYPSVLANHFQPEGCWLLRNLRFQQPLAGRELLNLLDTSRALYYPGRSEYGVFPVNFNFGPDGLVHKGQFLCLAPSFGGSKMLLQMAKLDLPCKPDRD